MTTTADITRALIDLTSQSGKPLDEVAAAVRDTYPAGAPFAVAVAQARGQIAKARRAANDNAITDEQAAQAREAYANYERVKRTNPFAAASYSRDHSWFIEHGRRLVEADGSATERRSFADRAADALGVQSGRDRAAASRAAWAGGMGGEDDDA